MTFRLGMLRLTCFLVTTTCAAIASGQTTALDCIADIESVVAGYQNTAATIVADAIPNIQSEFALGDVRGGYAVSTDAQRDIVSQASSAAREVSRLTSICSQRLQRQRASGDILLVNGAFQTAMIDIGNAQSSAITQIEEATLGPFSGPPPIATFLAVEYTNFLTDRTDRTLTALESYVDRAVALISAQVNAGNQASANRLAAAARHVLSRSADTNVTFTQRTGDTGARAVGRYPNTAQLVSDLAATVSQAISDIRAGETDGLNRIDAAVGGVTPGNPPVNDTATTTEGTAVNIPVLANDPTGAQISGVTQPSNGIVADPPPASGPISYTPFVGFTGTDTFTYTITGSTQSATVTVTVIPGDDPPVDDNDQTLQDTPVDISVLLNDPIGAQITGVTQPSNGTTSFSSPLGDITYTPNTGFFGTDTFTYTIDTSTQSATVTVTVAQVGGGTDPVDDAQTTAVDTPVDILVLSNDPTGAQINAIGTQPTSGTATIVSPTGAINYAPNTGFTGTDSFTYTIVGSTVPATVTVTVGAAGTDPVDDSQTTGVDTPVDILVLSNDPTGAQINAIGTQPTSGTATIVSPTGAINYAPNTGFTGTDSFTYTIVGSTVAATVTVNVTNTPTPPPVSISVLVNQQQAGTSPGPTVATGGPANLQYIVTNNDQIDYSNVTVIDDNETTSDPTDNFSPSLASGDTNFNGRLDVGETWVYLQSITQVAVGQHTRSITVTADPPSGLAVSDATTANYVGGTATPVPGPITLAMLVNQQPADASPGPSVSTGTTATLSYIVTNNDQISYSNVTVVDDNETPSDPSDNISPTLASGDTNFNGRLDVGEVWVYTQSITNVTTGQHTRAITVTADPPSGLGVTELGTANFVGN